MATVSYTHLDVYKRQLPQRADFLLAAQGLRIEIEVLVDEGLAQVRRGAVHGVEAQIGAPGGRVDIAQHLADFLVEAWDGQRELGLRRHALGFEELGPGEIGGELVGVGQGDRCLLYTSRCV